MDGRHPGVPTDTGEDWLRERGATVPFSDFHTFWLALIGTSTRCFAFLCARRSEDDC